MALSEAVSHNQAKRRTSPPAEHPGRTLLAIVFALFLLAVGWAFFSTPPESQSLSSVAPKAQAGPTYSDLTLERINRHMQITERQAEMEALATEIENFELGARIKPGDFGTHYNINGVRLGNPFESENAAGRVYRDLNPSADRYDNPVLPQDRINSLVEQQQWLERYDQKQTRAFIEAVKANARAAGYELVINDQLQLVSYRRLPNAVGAPGAGPDSGEGVKSGEPDGAR